MYRFMVADRIHLAVRSFENRININYFSQLLFLLNGIVHYIPPRIKINVCISKLILTIQYCYSNYITIGSISRYAEYIYYIKNGLL